MLGVRFGMRLPRFLAGMLGNAAARLSVRKSCPTQGKGLVTMGMEDLQATNRLMRHVATARPWAISGVHPPEKCKAPDILCPNDSRWKLIFLVLTPFQLGLLALRGRLNCRTQNPAEYPIPMTFLYLQHPAQIVQPCSKSFSLGLFAEAMPLAET